MTPFEFQVAFERELNVFYKALEKPTSDTTFYWLNQAVVKFVKTRYSGTNAKTTSFEQDQKRIDDLRTLVTRKTFTTKDKSVTSLYSKNEYSIELPGNYVFLVGTRVGILPRTDVYNKHLSCWNVDNDGNAIMRYVDPIEVTHDTLDRELENSLSEHHVHYCSAKPLKLSRGNRIMFYTDDHYRVDEVQLEYIRTPRAITLVQPFVNYLELPEHTHQEIVKLAVQMYLESTTDQRYTSYSNEVNTME